MAPLPDSPYFQALSPTQFMYRFPSAPSFEHLVVFLLPGSEIPVGSAAGIYIQLPGNPSFKFLGALGSDKPSAIFRIQGLPSESDGNGELSAVPEVDMDAEDGLSSTASTGNISLGISLEPEAAIAAQISSSRSTSSHSTGLARVERSTVSEAPSTKLLAQRIIANAFNFLASFEGGDGKVPLKTFEAWWRRFESRIDHDPGFLLKDQAV